MQGPLQYMVWYHAVGLIWISEFILAFQQMTIAGAVVTYYFTRYKRSCRKECNVVFAVTFIQKNPFLDFNFNYVSSLYLINLRNKSQMPVTPILSSMARTIRYHLGTLAKGSFIITLVKIPRLILTYIHSQLKGKENACARCMLKACVCCLWCLEKCLAYLNQVSDFRLVKEENPVYCTVKSIYSVHVHVVLFQNAYTATAINSTNFCTSARDAFLILVENALRVAAINTMGDFVLFLGKVPHRAMFFYAFMPPPNQTDLNVF